MQVSCFSEGHSFSCEIGMKLAIECTEWHILLIGLCLFAVHCRGIMVEASIKGIYS